MLRSRTDLKTLAETGETNWTHEALQAVSLTSACFSHFLRPAKAKGAMSLTKLHKQSERTCSSNFPLTEVPAPSKRSFSETRLEGCLKGPKHSEYRPGCHSCCVKGPSPTRFGGVRGSGFKCILHRFRLWREAVFRGFVLQASDLGILFEVESLGVARAGAAASPYRLENLGAGFQVVSIPGRGTYALAVSGWIASRLPSPFAHRRCLPRALCFVGLDFLLALHVLLF